MYEHKCLENINKLYTFDGKWDDQIPFTYIIEAPMIYNTEIYTNYSPISPGPPTIVKKYRARK